MRVWIDQDLCTGDGICVEQSISPVVELIERYSEPGWVVADPFLGGGTTGVAAIQGKRQFIGCELDPDQAIIAANRLTNL